MGIWLVVLKENIKSLNSLKKVIFPFSNIIVAAEEEDPNDQGKFMLSEIIHTSIIRTFLDQIPQLKEDLTKNIQEETSYLGGILKHSEQKLVIKPKIITNADLVSIFIFFMII